MRGSAAIGLLALALAQAGCAFLLGETRYGRLCEGGFECWGEKTGGYTDSSIAESEYIVRFRGVGVDAEVLAQDFGLLRCAELTLESGHDYFVILEAEDDSYVTTSTSCTPSTVCGKNGCTSAGTTCSTQSTTVPVFSYWIEVKATPEDADGRIVYDAQRVERAIRARRGMPAPHPVSRPPAGVGE